MAGRNTSKALHETKVGHVVEGVAIAERDWLALEELAAYTFSPLQREVIAHELARCRDYADYSADLGESVTQQDIKRTLSAIAKMQPDDAVRAFEQCDQITDMRIFEAAWTHLKVNALELADPALRGETIAKAAAIALENLPKTSGGRPPKGHHKRLAELCCILWEACGNDITANTWDETPSRTVEFASYIFDLVDDETTDPATISGRLNEAKNGTLDRDFFKIDHLFEQAE